jgi:hypothetical protein
MIFSVYNTRAAADKADAIIIFAEDGGLRMEMKIPRRKFDTMARRWLVRAKDISISKREMSTKKIAEQDIVASFKKMLPRSVPIFSSPTLESRLYINISARIHEHLEINGMLEGLSSKAKKYLRYRAYPSEVLLKQTFLATANQIKVLYYPARESDDTE